MALTEHERIEDSALPAEIQAELAELRRRADELETERDAALSLADTRTRWLAHVSHELRIPMNGILGMTQLALDTDLSPEQREHLDLVRRSADSLMTLINDTLDHAKLSAGKLTLEQIPFNLRDAIELATKAMALTAGDKGIALVLDIDPELPLRMVGDPGRLRQVIFNLVGNAIKFTAEGGVTVRIEQVARSDDQIAVAFTVGDTGIGIAEDRLAGIFEPFEQASSATARVFGGTGLGLAISTQLVESMGGKLHVTSEVGVGTEFFFTIALDEGRMAAGGSGSGYALSDLRALVISDNPVNRTTLVEMLDSERMAGVVVETVAEARTYMRKATGAGRGFDLLILDLERRGLEVAAALQDDAVDATTLYLTPSGQRGDAARCRELGIDAYLTGVLEAEDIANAVRAARDGTSDLVTRHWLREQRRPLSILLADGNTANRLIAVRLLERLGQQVTAVADGQQAVDEYLAGNYDAVILDLDMPVKDGLTAAREIRVVGDGGVAVPIVALTGHASAQDRARLLAAGMDEIAVKPFQVDEVLALLDRLLTAAD